MRLGALLVFLTALASGILVRPAHADKRVALVIGNGRYAYANALYNPPNDASAMSDALRTLGFEVISGIDLDRDGMERKLREFLNKANSADVTVLFYAGHGIQVDGRNYLIPIDAKIETASDLNFGTIDLDKILESLDDPARANIIILDACRDNPLARTFATRTRTASVGTGLAAYTALGTGILVAFSTAPGKVAQDGSTKNSPFTASLLKHIVTPGIEVRQMLTRVRADVALTTRDRQVPWDNSSLRGDVYLGGPPVAAPAADEIAWNSLAGTTDTAALRRFVDRYPLSTHRDEALASISRIEATAQERLKAEQESNKAAAEARLQAEQERSKAAAEERLKAEQERNKAAEEERLKAEQERSKTAALEAAAAAERLKAEQERNRAAAEEHLKAEQERNRAAAEERLKAEQERSKTAALEAAAAEERLKAEQAREKIAMVVPPAPLSRPCGDAPVSVSLASRSAEPLSQAEECALKQKDTFKECETCPEMVVVPAGSFIMGSPNTEKDRFFNEGPQHEVTFAHPFAVGRFAVTFDEWDACVAAGGCNGYRPPDRGWGRGRRPVINVSWNDAKAYIAWLSDKTGKPYRLLSEAEREYVTRAGSSTAYWWGPSPAPQQANYSYTAPGGPKGDSRRRTVPVDWFQPNPWGLYQVHGNSWDWTEDCFHDGYAGAPSDGSAWTTGDCISRMLRGGSYANTPDIIRAAMRGRSTPAVRNDPFGFGLRVARTLTGP